MPSLFATLASTALVLAACGGTAGSSATPTASVQSRSPVVTPIPTPACSNQLLLGAWSLQRLAAQTLVVPVDENHVGAVSSEITVGVGGIILFGSSAPPNLGSQLRSTLANAPGGVLPFVMSDEEGGAVQRMANLVGSIPSARTMGATMSAAGIQQLATTVGGRMRAAGVSMDLAPVLDVDGGAGPSNADPDGTRSFSADERVASADGRAFAAGLEAAGVVPVVKHFPGLGGATGNTDVTRAATQPWSSLQRDGLLPFADAINRGAPAVMIANATVPGLTTLPASLSRSVIQDVLRDRLGFRGLVMTDSLSAVAIQSFGYSVPQATVAALEAGADMVLFSADAGKVAGLTSASIAAELAAVQSGALPRAQLVAAVAQVLASKNVDLCTSGG